MTQHVNKSIMVFKIVLSGSDNFGVRHTTRYLSQSNKLTELDNQQNFTQTFEVRSKAIMTPNINCLEKKNVCICMLSK